MSFSIYRLVIELNPVIGNRNIKTLYKLHIIYNHLRIFILYILSLDALLWGKYSDRHIFAGLTNLTRAISIKNNNHTNAFSGLFMLFGDYIGNLSGLVGIPYCRSLQLALLAISLAIHSELSLQYRR